MTDYTMTVIREVIGSETSIDRREAEMRTDLYRAVYHGDLEGAEDIINLMAMVGIDEDAIFLARRLERVGV